MFDCWRFEKWNKKCNWHSNSSNDYGYINIEEISSVVFWKQLRILEIPILGNFKPINSHILLGLFLSKGFIAILPKPLKIKVSNSEALATFDRLQYGGQLKFTDVAFLPMDRYPMSPIKDSQAVPLPDVILLLEAFVSSRLDSYWHDSRNPQWPCSLVLPSTLNINTICSEVRGLQPLWGYDK